MEIPSLNPISLSVIVPVRNQPVEVSLLLEKLTTQTRRDFEVILVEDGSKKSCEALYQKFRETLKMAYLIQKHSGPGPARNLGASIARTRHFLFLLPEIRITEKFIEEYIQAIQKNPDSILGGPGLLKSGAAAFQWVDTDFNRRTRQSLRAFSFCVPATLFHSLRGFRFLYPGEVVEFGLRAKAAGAAVFVLTELGVECRFSGNPFIHFTRAFQAGRAQAILHHWHPQSIELRQFIPLCLFLYAFFLLFLFCSIVLGGGFSAALFALVALPGVAFLVSVGLRCFQEIGKSEVVFPALLGTCLQELGYGFGFLLESLLWGVRKIKAVESLGQNP